MGKLNNPLPIVDRLAELKPASFSNIKTELPQTDYKLSLSDEAKFEIEQFVTNALLVSQYTHYQEARAAGQSPAAALVAANAGTFEQELAYELLHMTKALGVIGGTVLYRSNCPDIELYALSDLTSLISAYPAAGWCVPEEFEEQDRWLIVNLNPELLTDFLKSKISDGSLTPELLEWLKSRLNAGDITDELLDILKNLIETGQLTDELRDLIQDLIDAGILKDIYGNPIGTGGIASPFTNPTPTASETSNEVDTCLARFNSAGVQSLATVRVISRLTGLVSNSRLIICVYFHTHDLRCFGHFQLLQLTSLNSPVSGEKNLCDRA